jgi:cytoskeletal protein CcmA (bactofilin family)
MFAKVKERIDANRPTGRMAPASEGRSMPSIIGPDMTINGNLQTPGEVHVEGRIDGDIGCSKLTVGPTGWVRGCVTAVSARIHGHVTGAIHAEEVFLLSGSEVVGDIVQDALEIAPGASFEGRVHRRRAGESLSSMPAIAAPLVPAPLVPAADPAPVEPELPATAGPAPVAATTAVPAAAALPTEQADVSVNETKITLSTESVDSTEQSDFVDETIADEPASSPTTAENSGNGGAGRPVKGKAHANGHGNGNGNGSGNGNGHGQSSPETRPGASLAAE